MKTYVILFLVLLASIGMATNQNVNDEFTIPSYEANKTVNITATCINVDQPCGSEVQCNATIYHPNLSFLVHNVTMNLRSPGLFNLTIIPNVTQTIGTYSGYITCIDTTDSDFVGGSDASFRVVDKLLYHGGGIQTFDIAITIGVALIAIVLAILAVFGKSLWLRTLMLFSSLATFFVLADVLVKIATLNSQTAIASVLEGQYFLVVMIAIVALGLFIVNFLWDLAESLGRIPKWAGNMRPKKKETLEE